MRRLARVLCAVLACGAVSTNAIAEAPAPLWIGVFENRSQSSDGIEAAIETAVAKMSFIKRPIARSRLKKTNEPHKKIVITQQADVISVAFDDRKPVQMPADGRPIKWTRDDGEVFDVSVEVTDEGLVQTFKAEDGQRVNTFSANDAGQMTMEARLTSPQLTTPVIYTLLYHRTSN
jgi:hypothetical protein